MSVPLADAKRKFSARVGTTTTRAETATVKRRLPTANVESVRRHSEVLTEQWRARRKAILLNPKGLPRLTVAKLIQAGRK